MTLHSRLVRHVLHPLALWRRGESAQLRWQAEFDRTQWLSADELRDLQSRRLAALLRHAYASCPFYRQRFVEAGLTPDEVRCADGLRRLPVLEKGDIQRHGPEMVARGWPGLIRNQTGGSTGTPLSFFLDRDRKNSRAAATIRHNAWAGYRVGDPAAVVWGAPQDRPGTSWRARFRDWLMNEPLWLDTACLTEQSLHGFHKALLRQRPRIIQAYARSLVLLARWLREQRLVPHRPHAIITSAEVLEDEDRALVEEVFGCRVFNRYGCREVSVIASECPAHAGMHVMAEGLLVEIETPTGPAWPGETGCILVTDLLNQAMPLIRYRIGDMGSWAAGACPCGRALPRLEKVAGRVTEFLVGAEGQLVSGVYLATYVVAQRPSLGQAQLVQTKAGEVTYRLRPGPGFDPVADRDYLESATRRCLGMAATCDLEIVAELPTAPSGKFLFSRSTVTPAFLAK